MSDDKEKISPDWAQIIYSSYNYFNRKLGFAPNRLLIHPEVYHELIVQTASIRSYGITDFLAPRFMGHGVWVSMSVKQFCWAFVIEE